VHGGKRTPSRLREELDLPRQYRLGGFSNHERRLGPDIIQTPDVTIDNTVLLRGGVYREILRPKSDNVTFRAIPGEKAIVSGADLIEGWTRAMDGSWSAPLSSKPKKILRDGQLWSDSIYDATGGKIIVKGFDPRLHQIETVVRDKTIDLSGKTRVKVEGVVIADTL
jgi:hypothetical protein